MRLIDADKLKQYFTENILCCGYADLSDVEVDGIIDKQPTEDAKPVVHAKWEVLENCSNAGVYCSRCGKNCFKSDYYANVRRKSKYCPNCGAKMDKEVK